MNEEQIQDLKKRCELADDVISKVFRYSKDPNKINELTLAKAIEYYNNYLVAIGEQEVS